MPGTLLLDDLRDSVGNQLGDYVNGLTQQATAAVQPIAAAIPTPQAPSVDPNAILQELQQHAQQAAQAAQEQAQPALQVLGGAQQAAAGAVTQLGQTRDQVAQQLQQHAQDVVSGAQDVQQQLQDHANTVLGSTTPQVPAGVQSLANPTPPPTLGATDQAANAPPTLGATTGAVSQPAPAGAGPMGPIDSSSPSAFARSIAPYAQYAAQKLGIDPTWVAAMAGSESNYGKAAGNELFGVKALPGQPGTSMQTHEGEYGGTQMNQTFAAYDSPLDAVNAWVDLIQKHYPGAVNAQDLPTFIHGLRQGGYFTAAEDEYLGIVKGISDRIGGDVQAGLQAVGIAPKAPAQVTTAQARAADLGYTDVSQFGDKQLSADEAYAACGPATAVRFAERFGRNPTLREATDLAKQVGWTSSGGMAGIQSEQKLLANMGVDTHVVAPDWDAIAKEAQTGNPVTISTPGHYYFADGYNPDTGAFHVGQSGLDLKHGSEWMTPAQMESLMGKAQGALFADNPNVPAKGAAGAPVTLGGGGTQNAPITMGANQPAKAPLVVPEDQAPTPIQSAADVVGGAANDALEQARQALQQAQDALGRATQGAQQTVAPILGGAQQTVSAVAQDVQNAAQGTLGAAQDLNRQIPTGTAAVNAAAPVLGGAASDLGTTARGAADTAGQTLGGLADQAHQQIVDAAQTPAGQALIQAGVQNATDPSLLPAGSRQLYQQISDAKNQWIDQNNPLRDVPFPVVAGLVSGIAQQLTDPIALATFGPTVGAGEAAGTAVAERLAPEASRFVQQVAEKLTSGAIVGGIQNGLAAAEAPGATPQSVGEAVLTGAGLGAAVDVGGAALRPVVANVGRMVLDRAAEAGPAIAEFARSETGAVGRPEDVRALAAQQAGREAAPAPAPEMQPSNPYDLPRSAPQPGAVPMAGDEVLNHLENLDQLHTQNDARIAELQNRLSAGSGRGDYSGTVVRPPWAVGWTNQGLEELARRNNLNPYEANWWERGNFVPGTGEMREDVGQSGIAGGPRYSGPKLTQQSPTEMRAELARLETQQQQIETAHESIWDHAGQGGDVYPQPTAEALPFDRGGVDTGAAQTRPGLGRETPSPARGSAEAPAGVPGPSAAVPAERSAPTEVAGFRAPEPPVAVPLPPERPPAPASAAPPPGGGSPELDRLNAMFDGKKPAPTASVPDRLQAVGDWLTRNFTDRQVDINRAQERYAANLGRPLRGDEMAAELQRLASDPVAQVKVDEGLKPAIQSVGADYPALRNYVTLRSNIEVADNLAARTGKPEVGSERMFSGGLNRDQSAKALQDLETQLGPARFARVQAAADHVTAFNQMLRQRLVDAQVLDPKTAASFDTQYPNWAKTRILDYMADPAGGQGAGTKLGLNDRGLREYTLTGTERAREDPIASTVAYAHQVERMAMKNEAFNAFRQIDQAGESSMLREVPQSYTPKSNEVTMIGFVNGEKQKFVTDNKALGAAINGASVLSTPEWTSAWQKIFRSLATSRNPLFLAGNAALDIPTYVLRSAVREGGPQALPRILGELARGYGDAFQGLLQGEFRGAGTSEFLKGGGGQAGFFTGGEGQTKQAIAEMQRKNVFQINGPSDLGRLTKDLLTLHPVEALGERIELGPRVAAMRLAQRRGANPTQAVIDGRTVTVDFSQGGTVTKYLNNFIPFFNVGFQGPAQIARAMRDNPRAFVATVGTLIGVPSAVAEVWNKSDPQRAKDYADVPQYVKDQGVVIMLPGEAPVDAQGNRKPLYAVIKLREWAPFAAMAREATDRAMGDDSRSWQEMASSIGSGLSPIQAQSAAQVGTEPLGGIPILPAAAQLQMNTDFFRGRTIVTQRADQNASALAKTLTPAIQRAVDTAGINAEIRPSAIDFLIHNQGAGVGGAVTGASDLAVGRASDVAGPTGLPVVGGLIGRFAGSQTGDELQRARDQTLTQDARQILRSNGITVTPGAVSGSVNQIPLRLDEETRYQQLTNQYIDEAIKRTAASSDFARMTQVGKQSLIDQAMQAARQKAGIQVLNTIPAAEKSQRLRTKSTAA